MSLHRFAPSGPPLFALSAARTSPGAMLAANEDSFLDRPDIGLWAVADGLGGDRAGERASGQLVRALGALPRFRSGYAFLTAVRDTLDLTNEQMLVEAHSIGRDAVVGSTIAAVLVFDGRFACVWAGDSRVYRFRQGRLEQLTRDHSLVQDLVEGGMLTAREARSHPHASIITRAVGVADELQLDLIHGATEEGDVFLLCTDGLTGALADEDLEHLLASRPLEMAADALLEAALGQGAKDSVTLVLVQLGAPPNAVCSTRTGTAAPAHR